MHPPLPFNARAARTLREKLGMTPGHVAYGMRASFGMTHITPEHVAAWERGAALPTSEELTALAGALWCAPAELMGHPRTLREHRLARGLPAEDVARATGLTLDAYHHMEETGRWTGDKRQSAALGSFLGLPPRDFIAITGLEDELARLLTEAVSTRWQAHIKPIAKLVAMERRDLQDPLRAMQQEYQTLMAVTLSRAGGTTASGEAGHRYVEEIVDHFWSHLPDH
ncbi:helix-turn-helix transcriptional regulator [Streptomyces sp. NPDC006274]|uniref:helix-turn-helix transcriptional regulator n=1 Tax=unclassified Streptomyces TaxID=2593676 RepID=UPI0033BEB887